MATGVKDESLKPKIFTGSFLLALSILIVVLIVWGGLIVGQKYLSGKIATAQSEYQAESQQLSASNAQQLADFQSRTSIASTLLKNRPDVNVYLGAMEKDIVPPVYLTSFQYDSTKKTLTVSGVADGYRTVARQLLSFKNDSLFSSVSLGSIQMGSTQGQNSQGQNSQGQGTQGQAQAGSASAPSQMNFSATLTLK